MPRTPPKNNETALPFASVFNPVICTAFGVVPLLAARLVNVDVVEFQFPTTTLLAGTTVP